MIPTYQAAQIGMFRRPVAGGGGGGYQTETNTWETRIIALGGSVTTPEKDMADAFVVAAKAFSGWTGLRLFYPLIGASVAAHRVPLIDKANIGAASLGGSSPFTDADCDTTTGLVNSTEKDAWMDCGATLNFINGVSLSGGLGFIERNWGAGSNVEPIGAYDSGGSERYCIDGRSTFSRFRWGPTTGSQVGLASTFGNGHWYGQRTSSTLRKIYKDGTLQDTATSANGAAGTNDRNLFFMGCNPGSGTPWKGRCGAAYVTDGQWSDSDAADFYTLVDTYITVASGR